MGRVIALLLALIGASATAQPARVVSINLCTDQLAMMLAAPGQLVAVSHIARDGQVSAMVEAAQGFPIHHGGAEEIYLLDPDLVLASSFTSPATLGMLRRLGIPVEIIPPANTLDEVRSSIAQVGRALGQEAVAGQMLAAYDARLAALSVSDGPRPRAALYAANGYTSGRQSLAGHVLDAAGLENIAVPLGYEYSGVLPLELLVMAQPDLVIASSPYPMASRAEEILKHPALQHLTSESGLIRDADWICGTPHILRAVEAASALRDRFLAQEGGS